MFKSALLIFKYSSKSLKVLFKFSFNNHSLPNNSLWGSIQKLGYRGDETTKAYK